MKNFELGSIEKEKSDERSGTEQFELEGSIPVEIKWKEFEPTTAQGEDSSVSEPKESVVFLPGWAMGTENQTIEGLCKKFADISQKPSFAVTSRSEVADVRVREEEEKDGLDFLYEEAKAIAAFIKEKGITDLVLSGHSQGADKVIDLASILQTDLGIKLKGIILLSPVGLYEQHPAQLMGSYIWDSILEMLTGVALATKDSAANVSSEMTRSRTEYFKRLSRETREMSRKNPHVSEIDVPVIIVSGKIDVVSDSMNILSEDGIRNRENFLKENLFPRSPYIRMIISSKHGHHELPYARPESVAETSMHLIDRFYRQTK